MAGRREGGTWSGVRELENGRAMVLMRSRVLVNGVVPGSKRAGWQIERDRFGVGRGVREQKYRGHWLALPVDGGVSESGEEAKMGPCPGPNGMGNAARDEHQTRPEDEWTRLVRSLVEKRTRRSKPCCSELSPARGCHVALPI